MRLADHIADVRGTELDTDDVMTNIHAAIMQAQRFELRDDVAEAGYRLVGHKPSTITAAIPLTRLPHNKMWLEWRGGVLEKMTPTRTRGPNAPTPFKQGALIEAIEGTGSQLMQISLAWAHWGDGKDLGTPNLAYPNVCPFGILFDNRETPDLLSYMDADIERMMQELPDEYPEPSYRQFVRDFLTVQRDAYISGCNTPFKPGEFKGWDLRRDREQEALRELLSRSASWICSYAWPWLFHLLRATIKHPDNVRELIHEWESDTAGEVPFLACLLAMINSRNATESSPVDLTKINRARRKAKKHELVSYSTTTLAISKTQERIGAARGMSREAVRQHMVRGHFKIRRSGVFWWSPFLRGDASNPMQRREYDVHA